MNIVADSSLRGLVDKSLNAFRKADPMGSSALDGSTISVSTKLDIDAGAVLNPIAVDSNLIGDSIGVTAAMDSAFKVGNVGMQYQYNHRTGKYDMAFAMGKQRSMVGDSSYGMTMDAAGVLINGQLLSPNAVNMIQEVFKQPLAWSDAQSLVKVQTGDNPWAEAQSFFNAAYSGWGTINTSGSPDNTNSADVEIQSGMMSQPIINLEVGYKLSVQELERAKTSGANVPYAGTLIAQKQAYAKWVLDTMEAAVIYYGNAATGNNGILNVNTVTAWTSISGNETLTTIQNDGANTAKGSKIYRQLATAVASFLSTLKNKVSKVNIRVSPEAYNQLGFMAYSDVYDPTAALQIMMTNFQSGAGKGAAPVIEIKPDPMLSASGDNNFFNSINNDYLVITAEQIPTGPAEEAQSLLHFGRPLGDFVYPVVPQQYSTQYKYLRRISGIFAPLSTAVKVYSTYGK